MSKRKSNEGVIFENIVNENIKNQAQKKERQKMGRLRSELVANEPEVDGEIKIKSIGKSMEELERRFREIYPGATLCLYDCTCTKCFRPMTIATRKLNEEELRSILLYAVCFECLSTDQLPKYQPWRENSVTKSEEIMTKHHPRWEEYLRRLFGPEGLNFRFTENGSRVIGCDCKCGRDKTITIGILKRMGGIDIEKSIEYFEAHGGFCDCGILSFLGRDFLNEEP
jgi:hypothetical protein